ncbi:MAG TPA: HAD-IIA family hydrolase [Miltoncostaeaceae bacterium]|nr:HAD-IIA family hydrolase [Miltoncostaeaceae bacterium]
MTWALDLDGVVWLSGHPLPGAPEAIARLRAAGERVVFLTNNSSPSIAHHVATLVAAGIPATPDDVLTSAQAAALLVPEGSQVVALGGDGVREALAARGCVLRDGAPADAVVVGLRRDLTYGMIARAATAARDGALFVGTNDDPTYPTPDGLLPGAGAIVAAVATAAGRAPVLAGKPHPPMAALVHERVGEVHVMVGDRHSTDGLMARRLGARFALVLTGVTTPAAAAALDPPPDLVAAGLDEAVNTLGYS